MPKNESDKYRDEVMIHLTYIREKVDANHKHLEKVNGRLSVAENSITAIKTIGTTITVIIGIILTWLGIQE
tara:strand:+ start:3128 stop:3340 length:213 start_codon:yes stop_codon:yes gene_type:complete